MTDNITTRFNYNNSNHDSVPKDVVTTAVDPSVTTIENYAFYQCTSLTTIKIPSQVTTIGNHAFNGCTSLTSINMPQVTTVGISAFYRCTSLKAINITNLATTIGGTNTFLWMYFTKNNQHI
jgi:hypothetical protein